MKKTMGVAGLILLTAAGSALASGYRIPEQSVNSTARAGSYVAYTPGADASLLQSGQHVLARGPRALEVDATWIHLSSIEYTDSWSRHRSGDSEEEDFLPADLFCSLAGLQ